MGKSASKMKKRARSCESDMCEGAGVDGWIKGKINKKKEKELVITKI